MFCTNWPNTRFIFKMRCMYSMLRCSIYTFSFRYITKTELVNVPLNTCFVKAHAKHEIARVSATVCVRNVPLRHPVIDVVVCRFADVSRSIGGDKGKHRKDSKSPFSRFKKSGKSRDVSPSGRTGSQALTTKIRVTGSDFEYTESEASEDLPPVSVVLPSYTGALSCHTHACSAPARVLLLATPPPQPTTQCQCCVIAPQRFVSLFMSQYFPTQLLFMGSVK